MKSGNKVMSEEFSMYDINVDGHIYNKHTHRQLKGSINSKGYLCVRLKSDFTGKFVTKTVHRLIAKEHLKDFDETLVVNHIDGVKLNNSIKNLEMVTLSQNTKHAIRLGLAKVPDSDIGEKSMKRVRVKNLTTNESVEYQSISQAMHSLGYKSIPGSWTRRKYNSIIIRNHKVTLL